MKRTKGLTMTFEISSDKAVWYFMDGEFGSASAWVDKVDRRNSLWFVAGDETISFRALLAQLGKDKGGRHHLLEPLVLPQISIESDRVEKVL